MIYEHLSEINIYPIKSLKGISLENSPVEKRGLQFDRRWMLVDADKRLITQREVPGMALMGVSVGKDRLAVRFEDRSIDIPMAPTPGKSDDVGIWKNIVPADVYDRETNAWFSQALGVNCRLVAMPETTRRPIDPEYAIRPDDVVSFADGYPFLLISEASLAELNSRLEVPVPMNRFRPNFVVSGSGPFEEDGWKIIRIGNTVFHVVKPCARCVLTTIDQSTGIKDGKEPLKTLAEFRTEDGKVLFGQNLIAENVGGSIKVGEEVEVLERR
jgi:uncharacterized protein YcbX